MKLQALSLVLTPFFWVPFAHAASFDCKLASNYSEKHICGNDQLSTFDDQVSALYKASMAISAEPDKLKLQQRAWLKRRNACTDEPCIAALQQARITDFRSIIAGKPATAVVDSTPVQAAAPVEEPVIAVVGDAVDQAPQPEVTEPKPISRREVIDLASLGIKPYASYLWGLWSCVTSNNGAPSYQRFDRSGGYESWTPDGVSHYKGTFKLSDDGQVLETEYASVTSSYSTASKMVIGMPTNRDLIQRGTYGLTLCDFVDE